MVHVCIECLSLVTLPCLVLLGDEITCMVDVDNGIIRFYKNGVDQGIAYENESGIRGQNIVPAVCLGSNEGGKPVTLSLIQPPSVEELATSDPAVSSAIAVTEWNAEEKRSTIFLSGERHYLP